MSSVRLSSRWPVVTALLLVSATPAFAHVQQGQAVGFLAGLRHPISGSTTSWR